MQEVLMPILVQELTNLLFWGGGAVLTLLSAAVLQAGRKYLGEKTTDRLRDRLTEALQRGLADAATNGVSKEFVAEYAASYVERNLQGTLKKLGTSRVTLLSRTRAQIAANK
jgi:hypothetical protein